MSRSPTKQLSIEYAHIYSNQAISADQKLSIEIMSNVTALYPLKQTSFCILVDDYSYPDPTFNYDQFYAWLGQQGYTPDVYLRVSQLLPVCDTVIELLANGDVKERLVQYVRTKKYPHALFVAAWYLLRLNFITHTIFPPKYTAERLLNVLPQSFKQDEQSACEIIAETTYKQAVDLVEYRYFDGRPVSFSSET